MLILLNGTTLQHLELHLILNHSITCDGINIMNEFSKVKDREEKLDKFLETLTGYFSEKTTPTGLFRSIGEIKNSLINLNENLEKANESSGKLTKALNNITLFGVIVAGLGVLVAITSLAFEMYKYFIG